MEAKEAVAKAKTLLIELFSEETMVNLALEEISRDDTQNCWLITLGFDRPWGPLAGLSALSKGTGASLNRSYRVVTLTDDGRMLSIKRRDRVGD